MIRNFLRPPRGAGEWTADAVRVVGLLSVVAAAIGWEPTDAGILAFALPGLLIPRFVGVRPGFDIVYGVLLLVAAWSNVLDLYRTIPWWDLAVHYICTGAVAAMIYLLLARVEIVPHPRNSHFLPRVPMVMVPTLALALGVLWEVVEWAAYTFISDAVYVTYDDTIGDLVAGGFGGLTAGAVMVAVPLLRREPETA